MRCLTVPQPKNSLLPYKLQISYLFPLPYSCLPPEGLEKLISERQIAPGEFFVLQGMMVYVANVGKWEKKNFGNRNARLYCVFENGTESNMLLRSLAAALWKDKNSRQVVDAVQMKLFNKSELITEEDKPTGYIYVLRSLSEDPQIKEIEDLYKIGFSSQSVKQRIQNAEQDPIFFMCAYFLWGRLPLWAPKHKIFNCN